MSEQPTKAEDTSIIPGILPEGKIAIYGNVKAVNAIKSRLCPEASVDELVQFAIECDTTQLNPYRNQIYLVPRYDRKAGRNVCRTQVGIDGLRLVAQRTSEFAGRESIEWCGEDGQWLDVWLSSVPPAAARCSVRKLINGSVYLVSNVVLYSAYVQKTSKGKPMARWNADPAGQLGKCAEAGALRAAFPQELGSLMTIDEMGQADEEPCSERKNVTPDTQSENTTATVEDPQEIAEEEMANPEQKPSTPSEFEESVSKDEEPDKTGEPDWSLEPKADEGEQVERKNVTNTSKPEYESEQEDSEAITDAFIQDKGLTAKALASAACSRSKDQAEGLIRAKDIIESIKSGAKFAELTIAQQRQAIHNALNLEDQS